MPHAELKYSDDLYFNPDEIFFVIEKIINQHDDEAGECKGRAYPAVEFHHTHLLIEISMLTKPHRDEAFTQTLLADLEVEIKKRINRSCYFSLLITYSPQSYITNQHLIPGDPLAAYKASAKF